MAAHAALNSLTQILENLMQHNDQDQQYYYSYPVPPIISDDEGQQMIKYLHETLSFLQSFLQENYHHSHNSSKLADSSLEARIRDAAYHAEDLIESHISEHLLSEHEPRVRKLCKEESQRFRRVMEEFDLIVEEAKKIERRSSTGGVDDEEEDLWRTIIRADSSRPIPTGNNKRVVGFEEDLLKIKEWVCGESSSSLQIVSIVGMGGIGKTTLAKSIFVDSLVEYHFYIRAWITISQQYCLRDLVLKLLYYLIGTAEELSEQSDEDLEEYIYKKILGSITEVTEEQIDEKLKEFVYKSLKGRRYLIVMDDMWGTNVWDDFRRILPDDCNGSRVLLTTRLLDVAVYVDDSCSYLHHMKFLNEDQSWNLLREKVFAGGLCPKKLEIIGKKIATKCGGLPLAIVLAAGLLSKSALKTPHDWEKFAENVRLGLARNGDEHFSKIMSFSYDHLPYHLKPCFLYLGSFQEDYEISVFRLLQLWIAEGFVVRSPIIRSKSLEEVAEAYLEDLAKRNLVLITRKSSSTRKFRFCKIHDLLRDFCIDKAKDEGFFLHVPRVQEEYRLHLSLSCWITSKVLGNTTSMHCRSIVVSSSFYLDESELLPLAATSKLLRIFDGFEAELSSFPTGEVTNQFHLRYLSFTCYYYKKYVVPTSVSRLRNLQTLILQSSRDSFSLQFFITNEKQPNIYLPDEVWRMPQLRHLILHNSCHLPNPPTVPSVGAKPPALLQNLQTLSRVADFSFNKERIEMIPNLKKLGLIYINADWNRIRYHLHNIFHLHQLESLDLAICCYVHNFHVNFALPPSLRKLVLRGSWFPWKDMSVVGSLPNLEVLKLREFGLMIVKEWVTIEGEFPRLKFLSVDWIELEHWRTKSSHFPRLERLIIRNCPELEEIPCEIGDIPTLQLIEVGSKSKSAVDSAKRIQEEQLDLGNDSLQVRVIH